MYCDECGKEIAADSQFCGHCGAVLQEPAAGSGQELRSPAPPTTPAYAPPPSREPIYAPPPPPPGGAWSGATQPPPPTGKSKLVPVLATFCALLVVGIVVLVLMLTVFKGDGGKGGGGQAAPEPTAVAEDYLKALEDRDLDSLVTLLDPDFLEELEDEYGKEYEDILEGFFFGPLPEDLEFSGLKLSQEVKGDRAEVFVEEGEATYRGEDGKMVTEDLAEAMDDALEVEKKDGKWYITISGFAGWEDYLADYGGGKDETGGEGGLNEYESLEVGIGFGYPDGWVPEEFPEGMIEVKPIGAEAKATVTFYTEDLSGTTYGVEDWIASETGELDAQGWPYEVSRTTVDGNPAARIVFSYLGEQSAGYKVMDTFMVLGGTGYDVSYIALEEDFDTYLDAALLMIDSFHVIRL